MKKISGQVEFELEVLRATELAYLLTDGVQQAWCPKSQIDWDIGDEEDPVPWETQTFYFPEWLAQEKGFV